MIVRSTVHGTEAELGRKEAYETVEKHNENFGEGSAGVKVVLDEQVVVVPHPMNIDDPDDPEILEVVEE